MRIVVDINHPAHVHYFKNFIWEMQKRGHEILVTASDKDIAKQLLDLYQIPYISLGSYGKGLVKKIINIPVLDMRMWLAVRKFRPDILIGFGSIRATHTGFILGKKSLILDDTEHAKLGQMLYCPFASHILTPSVFKKSFENKQLRFNGTTDLLYLHPNRFTPDPAVLHKIGLRETDTYFIVRFISWDANHDIGQTGIADRVGFVHELARHGRVLITSENGLPDELKQYQITVSPEKIHDLMYYATLFVGESGTMATEAACMGVHAVVINPEAIQTDGSYTFGVFKYYHDFGLLWAYADEMEGLKQIDHLLMDAGLREKGKEKRQQVLATADDVTEKLVDMVCGIE